MVPKVKSRIWLTMKPKQRSQDKDEALPGETVGKMYIRVGLNLTHEEGKVLKTLSNRFEGLRRR